MTQDPYNQDHDTTFDAIVNPYRDQPVPARHPGGRSMPRPETPRTSRDQATLLLGCGGFVLMLSLAVAVITLAWRL